MRLLIQNIQSKLGTRFTASALQLYSQLLSDPLLPHFTVLQEVDSWSAEVDHFLHEYHYVPVTSFFRVSGSGGAAILAHTPTTEGSEFSLSPPSSQLELGA